MLAVLPRRLHRNMSVPFAGKFAKHTGLVTAIANQVKKMNLKPLNAITVKFDPFYENVKQTRAFLQCVSSPRVLKTNLTCALKTQIVCDRSEPTVTCDLITGGKVLFKCDNLDTLDLLTLYNKYVTPLAPPEPEPEHKGVIVKLKKKRRRKRVSKHRR